MGRIDEYTRRVYAEILFGFIRRDYHRVAEVHFEAGYVPADRDVDEFALALRAVGEPIFGMDASHISMGRLLTYLFEVTERFGMQTRTELILLQRTMVVVEGVARSLDPHINIWQVARPVVEDYIRKNIGPRGADRRSGADPAGAGAVRAAAAAAGRGAAAAPGAGTGRAARLVGLGVAGDAAGRRRRGRRGDRAGAALLGAAPGRLAGTPGSRGHDGCRSPAISARPAVSPLSSISTATPSATRTSVIRA